MIIPRDVKGGTWGNCSRDDKGRVAGLVKLSAALLKKPSPNPAGPTGAPRALLLPASSAAGKLLPASPCTPRLLVRVDPASAPRGLGRLRLEVRLLGSSDDSAAAEEGSAPLGAVLAGANSAGRPTPVKVGGRPVKVGGRDTVPASAPAKERAREDAVGWALARAADSAAAPVLGTAAVLVAAGPPVTAARVLSCCTALRSWMFSRWSHLWANQGSWQGE